MALETCALCPRLCRHACPVAVGGAREAAVPAVVAQVVLHARTGQLPLELGKQAATLCLDCGGCQDACHLHQPLPAALQQARADWLPVPEVEPLQVPPPGSEMLVVEPDGRSFVDRLSSRMKRPLVAWKTRDGLGEALRGHAAFTPRAAELQAVAAGRTVGVVDGASAAALSEAGVPFVWLPELLPELSSSAPRCRTRPPGVGLRCCGAAGPLRRHHLQTAQEVGRSWLRQYGPGPVDDARCASHLRELGWGSTDWIDRLLASEP